jgi:hypothetical protein
MRARHRAEDSRGWQHEMKPLDFLPHILRNLASSLEASSLAQWYASGFLFCWLALILLGLQKMVKEDDERRRLE